MTLHTAHGTLLSIKKRETVSNHVAVFREKRAATQQKLADAVGVTRQTIIAIERGNYTPSILLALKIAQHFHQPLEKVFQLS